MTEEEVIVCGNYIFPKELILTGIHVSSTLHISELPKLNTHELAWSAGFFDGEGCTYLAHSGTSRTPSPQLEVTQIHPFVLERFRNSVGGIGKMRDRPDRPEKRKSRMWSFYVRNWRDTQSVLVLLWPYLSPIKRDQAKNIFAAYQIEVNESPSLGRPNIQHLWTESACPHGHTDIYYAPINKYGYRNRRCRSCKKERTQISYSEVKKGVNI